MYNRLHGVKENVADLQQRLQQYQKKNDEMHEKIGTLERKVSCRISSFDIISRLF
jgi:chromosome segregation ATPase